MKIYSHILKSILISTFAVIGTSCGNDDPVTNPPVPDDSEIEVPDDRFAPLVEITLTDTEKEQIKATNLFGRNIWNIIESTPEFKDGNVLYSPISFRYALSMLANGAGEETKGQILSIVGGEKSGIDVDGVNGLNKKLLEEIPAVDTKVKLAFANGLWIDKASNVLPGFAEAMTASYNIQSAEFEKATEKGRGEINTWISGNTFGLIPEFLETPPVSDIVLANALYFGSEWRNKFEEKNTRDEKFGNADGSEANVKMMSMTTRLYWAKTDKAETITLPYGNTGFAMELYRPNDSNDFSGIFSDNIVESGVRNVSVKMPRFEYESEIQASQILPSLGYDKITGNDADYSGITGEDKTPATAILQKNRIEVDEKGTKAASATVVMIMGDNGQEYKNVNFFLDRPFAFIIRESSTGAILFMGKVEKL